MEEAIKGQEKVSERSDLTVKLVSEREKKTRPAKKRPDLASAHKAFLPLG